MIDNDWITDGIRNHWTMPTAPYWKRLPVIRHFRAAYHKGRVNSHETFWLGMGFIPSGYDRWVIYGIAAGMERPQ